VIDSFRNVFAIPDLRKRLFFTFALLAVYRVGCHIPARLTRHWSVAWNTRLTSNAATNNWMTRNVRRREPPRFFFITTNGL
jgi:preprotein translocase subunit SecY